MNASNIQSYRHKRFRRVGQKKRGAKMVQDALIELFGPLDGPQLLDAGKSGAFAKGRTQEVETVHV